MKKYLLPPTGNFYKANLHCHTNISDGKSSPEEIKKCYKSLGYHIVAYTDHDVLIGHNELTDDKFLALNGVELSINGKGEPVWANMETTHISFIAIEPDNLKQPCWHRTKYLLSNSVNYRDKVQFYEDEPDYERHYTGECISDMFKKGRECGFFTVYNHPTCSMENYTHYMNYHNMHAMEMSNGGNEYNPRVYDDMLRGGEKIFCVGGDDNHNPPDSTTGCGKSWTMIKAEKLDYRTITQALIDGNFYASDGPEIFELWIEDNVMHVKCSDARKIEFTASNRTSKRFKADGNNFINEASYPIHPDSKYVRVTITGPDGEHASSNAYFIKDMNLI